MKAAIDKDKHWFVVRTNVRCEEKASTNIRKAGYDVYYPRRRVEVKNKRTHTYTTLENPLMPRYLFVGLLQSDRNFFKVRGCDGVDCILAVDGRPARISADHVEAIYLAEVDLQFDDTRAARIHRKEEARSKKAKTESEFSPGRSIFVTERGSPFATFGGVVDAVTNAGRVIALIDIFGRMTPVEFEPRQLTPAA
ncbi:MAG: transcription termination/antitermination NusG family protein [Ensifer adhaerens]